MTLSVFRCFTLHSSLYFPLLVLCFLFIYPTQGYCAELQQKNAASIAEKTIRNYLSALQGGDMATIRKYFPDNHVDVSGQTIVKPCLKQARKILLENTTWKISKVNATGKNNIQAEATFKEPRLESLILRTMREELPNAAKQSKNTSLENQLCKNIAKSLTHVSKREVSSLARKTSIQCYSLVPTKDRKHWVITAKTNTNCKSEL